MKNDEFLSFVTLVFGMSLIWYACHVSPLWSIPFFLSGSFTAGTGARSLWNEWRKEPRDRR